MGIDQPERDEAAMTRLSQIFKLKRRDAVLENIWKCHHPALFGLHFTIVLQTATIAVKLSSVDLLQPAIGTFLHQHLLSEMAISMHSK